METDKSMMAGMEAIMELAEHSIKELSRARALMIKTGASEEDVTQFINRMGERYGKMYNNMTVRQIIIDMIGDLFKGLANREA